MSSSVENNGCFSVTTCLMGYGHLRAAHNVVSWGSAKVIRVDRRPNATAWEEAVWRLTQDLYHRVSRTAGSNGRFFMRMLECLVAISEEGGGTSMATTRLAGLFSFLGMGKWSDHVNGVKPGPTLHTFYLPALHSAYHQGDGKDYVLICDADCQRVWVPIKPLMGGLRYLVPCTSVADRLLDYGVRSDAVDVTGFPLPASNLGGPSQDVARADAQARCARLARSDEPLTIMIPLSGAGCYLDLLRATMESLLADLRGGRIRLIVAVGNNGSVKTLLESWLNAYGLSGTPCVEVLHDEDLEVAFDRFNAGLRRTDIMLTKPGELVFYAALGIPFVLLNPVGEHEGKNRAYLLQYGTAVDFPGTDDFAEWLYARRRDGTWERLASNGFTKLPRDGLFNIHRILGDGCPKPAA